MNRRTFLRGATTIPAAVALAPVAAALATKVPLTTQVINWPKPVSVVGTGMVEAMNRVGIISREAAMEHFGIPQQFEREIAMSINSYFVNGVR